MEKQTLNPVGNFLAPHLSEVIDDTRNIIGRACVEGIRILDGSREDVRQVLKRHQVVGVAFIPELFNGSVDFITAEDCLQIEQDTTLTGIPQLVAAIGEGSSVVIYVVNPVTNPVVEK
jgi:hypothetical protein